MNTDKTSTGQTNPRPLQLVGRPTQACVPKTVPILRLKVLRPTDFSVRLVRPTCDLETHDLEMAQCYPLAFGLPRQ